MELSDNPFSSFFGKAEKTTDNIITQQIMISKEHIMNSF